ncbi:hypothetical protein SNEBB_003684 [Seison nebaliae]|nr:hypothetical protein SNEBB_003684 [Seison nebaliae]
MLNLKILFVLTVSVNVMKLNNITILLPKLYGGKSCQSPNKTKLLMELKMTRYPLRFTSDDDVLKWWCGKYSSNLIISIRKTSNGFFSFAYHEEPSTVYLLDDNEKKFKRIEDFKNVKLYERLYVSPHDKDINILVGYDVTTRKKKLFLTVDGGKTWKMHSVPFQLYSSLIFHPNNRYSAKIVAISMNSELYYSQNLGRKWIKMRDRVKKVWWINEATGRATLMVGRGNVNGSNFEMFINYFTGRPTDKADVLEKVDVNCFDRRNDIKNCTELKRNDTFSTWFFDKISYISIALPEDNLDNSTIIRSLLYSKNYGDSWEKVHLSSINAHTRFDLVFHNEETNKTYFHIDDTTIKLSHNHRSNSGADIGQLYVNDLETNEFLLVVHDHYYPRLSSRRLFHSYPSADGVLTTVQQIKSDRSKTSIISYDFGVSWTKIILPQYICDEIEVETTKCYLQIFSDYNIEKIISNPNALGLIIVTGYVSNRINDDEHRGVFISSDGGREWKLALKGDYLVTSDLYGNWIIATERYDGYSTQNPIMYISTDYGNCWRNFSLFGTHSKFTISQLEGNNLVSNQILSFFAHDKYIESYIMTLNLQDLYLDGECSNSDYHLWQLYNPMDNSHCHLGQIINYFTPLHKKTCYNVYDKPTTSELSSCICTENDYQCEFGFERKIDTMKTSESKLNSEMRCVLRHNPEKNRQFKQQLCIHYLQFDFKTNGYKKLFGNRCQDGQGYVNHLFDLSQLCDNRSTTIKNHQKRLIHVAYSYKKKNILKRIGQTVGIIIGFMLIVVFIRFARAFGYVLYYTRRVPNKLPGETDMETSLNNPSIMSSSNPIPSNSLLSSCNLIERKEN